MIVDLHELTPDQIDALREDVQAAIHQRVAFARMTNDPARSNQHMRIAMGHHRFLHALRRAENGGQEVPEAALDAFRPR